MMTPIDMWDYWRDKYGYVDALQDYYPEQLQDPRLVLAVAQIRNAHASINAVMAELEATEEKEQTP